MVNTAKTLDFPEYKLNWLDYSFFVALVVALLAWFFPQAFASIESLWNKIILLGLICLIITILPRIIWAIKRLEVYFKRARKYEQLLTEIDQNKNDIDQLKSYIISLVGLVSQGITFDAKEAYSYNGQVYVNIKSRKSKFDEGSEFILIDKSDEYTYGIFTLVQSNTEECVLRAKGPPDPVLLGYLTKENRITFPPGIVAIKLLNERNYGKHQN